MRCAAPIIGRQLHHTDLLEPPFAPIHQLRSILTKSESFWALRFEAREYPPFSGSPDESGFRDARLPSQGAAGFLMDS